ncbi:uncharacterized protein LOC117806327 isoform X2 [Notolabrus celidotus]|uniref:uncharacterized protein LOC117806327 isoform X2 n=1 Tax=Notolabrus celidotus TaxID=1203425 RepID=UPI00148FD610|nr:uncharacterized protein LOC117806327 isoform X2 [Notolabrus celidotus]
MATGDKKRSSYFTPLELDILMQSYSECNLGGEKRTWKQLKMKYKNIIQTANRKKAEARKTGGGPPTSPSLTEAEEEVSQNQTAPLAEGSSSETVDPQDTSSFIRCSDAVLCFVDPHAPAELLSADEEDNKDVLKTLIVSAASEGDQESVAGQQEEAPSTSTAQMSTLPVQELYRMHLIKKMNKMDKEMVYLDRQIQKSDLEIEMLQHKLEEIKRTK